MWRAASLRYAPTLLRISFGIFLLIILGVSAWFGYHRYRLSQVNSTLLLPPKASPQVLFIDKHTSATRLAYLLKEKHFFHSPNLFLDFIAWQGVAHQLKAGAYLIQPGETMGQVMKRIIAGDALIETFTIIEGATLSQVRSRLKNASFLSFEENDFGALRSPPNNASLLTISTPSDLSLPEGLLLADTYHYRAGSDAKNLLQAANQHLLTYLNECWKNRDMGLPYTTPYELLIAASIVEKEAALPTEQPIIASVIVNRLNRKMPLQMDPTVIYALGDRYTGKLKHDDLSIDSPYNTYRYRGLPPTPIAMIGKAALYATAHPKTTNYLYFVAKGDGSHQFSATYEEQKQAIFRYTNGHRRAPIVNESLDSTIIPGSTLYDKTR